MATAEDTVLCFGNLPPLSRLKARTVLFIQNRYLTDDVSLDHFPKKTRVRLAVERAWLRFFSGNVDTIVVQTPTMKDAVAASLRREATVLPFLVPKHPYRRSVERSEKGADVRHDFLYVASGEPHKNHRRLIEAWKILASAGLFPTLCLTLKEEDGHRALLNFIDTAVREAGLKIVNRGALTQAEIGQLYRQSRALIYPSTLESFGLPLIEARNANLAVVASELDYVRDVLDPEESFDPTSSRSIARAVQRFLGHEEKALPLVDPDSFLNFCMQPTPDLHHGAPGSSG